MQEENILWEIESLPFVKTTVSIINTFNKLNHFTNNLQLERTQKVDPMMAIHYHR